MENFLNETLRCLEEHGYNVNSVSRIVDVTKQNWLSWDVFKTQAKFHYKRSEKTTQINPHLQIVLRDGTKFIRHTERDGFESWVHVPTAFAAVEVDELQYHF